MEEKGEDDAEEEEEDEERRGLPELELVLLDCGGASQHLYMELGRPKAGLDLFPAASRAALALSSEIETD